jgi:hypothetical protein
LDVKQTKLQGQISDEFSKFYQGKVTDVISPRSYIQKYRNNKKTDVAAFFLNK